MNAAPTSPPICDISGNTIQLQFCVLCAFSRIKSFVPHLRYLAYSAVRNSGRVRKTTEGYRSPRKVMEGNFFTYPHMQTHKQYPKIKNGAPSFSSLPSVQIFPIQHQPVPSALFGVLRSKNIQLQFCVSCALLRLKSP